MEIKKKKLIKYISCLIFIIAYMIFLFSIRWETIDEGYHITVLLPFIFLICFYLFLWEPLVNKKTPFIILFTVIAFIRYVILSIITILNGTYVGISGTPPASHNLILAGILMAWELLIGSIAIAIWSKKVKSNKNTHRALESNANISIYVLVICISIGLLFIFPQAKSGISLFTSINTADDSNSLVIMGVRELLINSKYFLLFTIIIFLQKKSSSVFNESKYLNYITALIVSLFIIGIRVGTNRKKLLADTLGSLVLMMNLFPKYKKITAVIVSICGSTLVALTTIFRGMANSVQSFIFEYFNLDFLQPYFSGQYNVAIAIESSAHFSNEIDINTYILGFLRPLFAIGSFIKNIDFTMVSDLFDKRMSWGLSGFRGDQIIPMIGEGYMLFGAVFAPLLIIIIIRLGIYFDSLYSKSKKIEIVFISSIISFFLAQGMILNSTILLNALSFRLAIFIPIVWLAYKIKKRR